jgi:sulfur carrier protein
MNATLTVNGHQTEAGLPCSLEEFIKNRGLHPGSVVVELNGSAISHSEFSSREIQDCDHLEIVNIVAGG